MADQGLYTAIQFIRQIADPSGVGELPDAVLLRRFIEQRDEAAFAAIVQRHGPLVLAVCQRVMHNSADSEDAFQATFLVLVRKARSIIKQRSIGSWLYGVAYRIAVRAKGERARRQTVQGQIDRATAAEAGAADSQAEVVWRDLRPVLDEEVQRLPDKCRVPLILCYLQGRTTEEAADLIGCPNGTVLSRLARARELLRARLVRRGLGLSAGLSATLLPERAISGALPAALAEAARQAALLSAAKQGVAAGFISGQVARLLEGELHAMLLAKLRAVGVVLLSACLVVGGGIMLSQSPRAAGQAEAPAAARQAGKKENATADPLGGNWTILLYERGGNPAPAQLIKTIKVVIQGDTFIITDGKDGEPATFKLDPAKKPKEIDLVFNEGPKKDIKRTALGIYEQAGDNLKLAWRKDGGPRPTEFASLKGERTSEYLSLKRESPAEKDASGPGDEQPGAAPAKSALPKLVGSIGPLPVAYGQPKDGLRLAIMGWQAPPPNPSRANLALALENVGTDDLVLNLGMMLANGKRQFPTAIRLTLTDTAGKTRVLHLHLKTPGIAGRVDPFVVPLAAGCRYTIPCLLDDYIDDDLLVRGARIPPGRYRLKAEFEGKSVARGDTNNDTTGIALMNYWTGALASGELQIEVPAPPRP